MQSKEYKLPNGKKVVFEYDVYKIGKITLECMDELITMITDRLQEDTVSRRYLLAEIDDLADEFSELDENGLHNERWCGISDAKRVIINTPSVSDRPRGKWLLSDLQSQVDNDNGNYAYVCTNCNHTDIHAKTQRVPYCWWCGAQMKGEGDDTD